MRRVLPWLAFLLLAFPCSASWAQSTYPSGNRTWHMVYTSGYTLPDVVNESGMIAAANSAYGGAYTFLTCAAGALVTVYSTLGSCGIPSFQYGLTAASCTAGDTLSSDMLTCTAAGTPPPDPGTNPDLVTPASIAALGISASQVLYVLTWGMGVVLAMWGLGFAAGAAVAVIKAI